MGKLGLLEREGELERLRALVGAAGASRGGALLIEGEAGIGKSALLSAAGAIARECGLRVLHAGGGALEGEFAYGLVRHLLERELAGADAERKARLFAAAAALAAPVVAPDPGGGAEAAPADALAREHGLYWLLSNLADEGPLALLLDDLHWADVATLRFLVYLARRLEGMQIVVVGAARSGEAAGNVRSLLDAVRGEPMVESIGLEPLSDAAVAALIAAGLGRNGEAEFARACHEVSGGNPFLLSELLRTVTGERIEPTDSSARRVRKVGPVGVSRSVLLRLARLPAEATALAQAVAVLGADAEIRHVAALAALSEAQAGAAADALAEARILGPGRPLEFLHPLVRNAIYTDLAPGRRARDHKRVARLLADDGAALERVAGQLLLTEPGGDEWVAKTLGAAAEVALARGAPEAAAEFLRRAIAEPPPAAERAAVLRALGSASFLAGDPAGLELLREGLEATADTQSFATEALVLSTFLVNAERAAEAVSLLQRAIARLDPADALIRQLDVALAAAAEEDITTASLLDRRLGREAERLTGESPDERLLLATLGYRRAICGDYSASKAASLAERALSEGRLIEEQTVDRLEPVYAVVTLMLADEFKAADAAIEQFFVRARSRGSWMTFSQASWLRAQLNRRLGALGDAVADARNSVEEFGAITVTMGLLLDVLVERGELDLAQAELEAANLGEAQLSGTDILPLFFLSGRGRLRIAQGDLRAGVDDLLELGRRCQRWGDANPAQFSWRSDAALALAQLGDRAEALTLAEDELERARRFGAPRAIANALRAVAVVEGGAAGIERLREALSVLEGSPAVLTRAKVLVEAGAAQRRANQRAAAREALLEGHELAQRCEAGGLIARAREELEAAGSRPRSVVRSGVDALTPSERRVCRLAAEGLSNPEIAQALFVTRATVESHLHSAYRKLDIGSRRELDHAGLVDPRRTGSRQLSQPRSPLMSLSGPYESERPEDVADNPGEQKSL